ncbi:MAG: hypothetical protein E7052_09255 [Lentisphaerae bacterium]|nr:hypothetical protein [Lentisphaerota bacterium]
MIQDVYEPLERYRSEFRERFAKLAEEKFAEMLAQSRVDEEVNAQQVQKIERLTAQLERAQSVRCFWNWMLCILIVIMIAAVVPAFVTYETKNFVPALLWGGLTEAAAWILLLSLVIPKRRTLAEKIEKLSSLLEAETAAAWEYMRPLNQIFDWGITAELIEKTVPRIQFDAFFNCHRLQELKECFDWSDAFNADKSVLCSHSGVINGNPFVFGRLLTMHWGSKTYTGTRTIFWTERVRGSDGKYHTEQRSQTLVATVDKPIPEYEEKTLLWYGNEAAADLTFSRQVSEYSGQDGFFARWGKKRQLKKLEKFSRNLTDDSNFTLMANHEFEVLFNAVDRSDEVEFRLLFTPLAQQQMLKLLNDTEVGYGDDFSFKKCKRMNIIQARHLDSAHLDDAPKQFHDYSLRRMREKFLLFNRNFFHDTFFALAPLLTVPLYQQYRTSRTIYGGSSANDACFWEHEALVNYMGENRFKHPASISRNILKTKNLGKDDNGVSQVMVMARGYRGEPRIERVRVFGQDGKSHWVDVPWVEYLPVENKSVISVTECGDSEQKEQFNNLYDHWQQAGYQPVYRRNLAAIIQR